MRFEMAIGDRLRIVTVERRGDLFEVTVDGRVDLVDARRIDDAALSLLIGENGSATPARSVDASVLAPNGPGRLDVHVAGRTVPVGIRTPGANRQTPQPAAAGRGPGSQRVVAPMPGKIVRVLVGAGQPVAARQALVVIEAMKMENDLRATRDGTVREVAVAEGQSVEAGAVLVTIE